MLRNQLSQPLLFEAVQEILAVSRQHSQSSLPLLYLFSDPQGTAALRSKDFHDQACSQVLFLTELLLSVPLPALQPLLPSVHTHSLPCPLQNENRGISCLPCSETGKKKVIYCRRLILPTKIKWGEGREEEEDRKTDRQTTQTTNPVWCLLLLYFPVVSTICECPVKAQRTIEKQPIHTASEKVVPKMNKQINTKAGSALGKHCQAREKSVVQSHRKWSLETSQQSSLLIGQLHRWGEGASMMEEYAKEDVLWPYLPDLVP